MRHVVLANRDSKRWLAWSRDLDSFCRERGVSPDVELVPWKDVVPCDGNLDDLPAFDRPALVRLESPGRDWEVTRLLLQAGARDINSHNDIDWLGLPHRKGLLVRPGLLHRGFVRVLRGLRHSLDRRPHLTPLACPLAVAEMFDKNVTAARLQSAGLPCPPSLPAPPTAAELLERLRANAWPTAYVKLAASSSATGIAVVHPLAPQPFAVTTLIRLPQGFHSTRRLREVRGSGLLETLQFILDEVACVQRGIAMAQIDGQNFDVRVIVIRGRVAFTVFRVSPAPMTNLHLGGRRGSSEVCRAAIPRRAWLDALDHCVEAARLYPCAMVGIDVLFERDYLRHHILELNAFGDFFPGLLDDDGRSVHRREIEAEMT